MMPAMSLFECLISGPSLAEQIGTAFAAQPAAGGEELEGFFQLVLDTLMGFLNDNKLTLIVVGAALAVLVGVMLVRGAARAPEEDEALAPPEPPPKTQKTQILAVGDTFGVLARLLGKEDAPPGVAEAMEELGQGRPQAAEKVLNEVLLRAEGASLDGQQNLEESTVLAANKEGAEAARHLGDLASLYDLDKAIAMYRRATIMDRSDPSILNRLGIAQLENGQLKDAEQTHRRALECAEQLRLLPEQAESHLHLGTVHLARHQLERARAELEKALAIEEQRGHRRGLAACHRQLARLFELEGDLEQAEERLDKALEIYRRDGDREGQAIVRSRLGMLFWRLNRLEEAEQMVLKALDISEQRQRTSRVASAHGNLGLIYEKRGQTGQALESFRQALDLFRKLGHRRGMALAHGNLGVLQHEQGDLDSAERSYGEALQILGKLNSQGDLACILFHAARLDHQRGKLDEAEKAFTRAGHLDQERGDAEDLGLDHKALAEVYDALGDDQMAEDIRALIPPGLPPRRAVDRRSTF